jgi:hypothetical protein
MDKILEKNKVYEFKYAIVDGFKIKLFNNYETYKDNVMNGKYSSLWKVQLMIDESNLLHIQGYRIFWHYTHYGELVEYLKRVKGIIPRENFIEKGKFFKGFKYFIIPQHEEKDCIPEYSHYMEKENEYKSSEIKLLLNNYEIIIV